MIPGAVWLDPEKVEDWSKGLGDEDVVIYSPSPEYPVACYACYRDEWRGEPRRSSVERRRVGFGAIPLRYPAACSGELHCVGGGSVSKSTFLLCPWFSW
jgi:hypothetical protein